MTVERYIRIMAGFFIMLSLALGLTESPILSASGSWPSRHLSGSTCSSRESPVLPTELPAEEAGSAGGGNVCSR